MFSLLPSVKTTVLSFSPPPVRAAPMRKRRPSLARAGVLPNAAIASTATVRVAEFMRSILRGSCR
jgi:hypothetical protein